MSLRVSFKVAIPARYASTRLPGKPLRLLGGCPMIEHVYRRAIESGAEEVVIATDDQNVRIAAEGFGAQVCMTSVEHPSGTDRLAEVAQIRQWSSDTLVVNLQGDEPLMDPQLIRAVAEDLAAHEDAQLATLCTPIRSSDELFDPNVVKVVSDARGYALYFSRAPIPWDRSAFGDGNVRLPDDSEHFRHIGLYAYRVGFLRRYVQMGPCYPEHAEALEQLRALWNGARIRVGCTQHPPGHGVDTEQDLMRVEKLLSRTS